ncbi:MAG TPA: ABC-type transport auxiliary lipoprotein family protein [Rhizomicrobium sp.]|nr:ABC-type transport auxiliary lipoprotein family protein [Rhizomicrobium sp.]
MTTLFRLSRRAALVIVSTVALSACGSLLGPTSAPLQIYVLHPAFGPVANAPTVQWQFGVTAPVSPAVFDSKRLSLTRGQTMDYYADAAWPDQTPDILQGLIVEAFEKSGKIKAVGRGSAGVRADILVMTEIRDFSAHYDSENGIPTIVVDLSAKLITATRHDVIASYDARREVKASVNSVPAVVAAFNDATGQSVNDIVAWALTNATPQASDALPPTTAEPVHRRHRRHH